MLENCAAFGLHIPEGLRVSFHCKKLIIYADMYEKYKDMFHADGYLFIPDDHAVADDITLDASTSVLYSEKLFILGDRRFRTDSRRI